MSSFNVRGKVGPIGSGWASLFNRQQRARERAARMSPHPAVEDAARAKRARRNARNLDNIERGGMR